MTEKELNKIRKKDDLVAIAEDMGIELPEPMPTMPVIRKLIATKSPATDEEQTLGDALVSHPRKKELRFYFSMRNARFRTGLTKDEIADGTELAKSLGLPVPK